MNEKEKLVKEKRLSEANAKNYIGLDGKFGVILRYLGKSILSQDSIHIEAFGTELLPNNEINYWRDPYELDGENEIPTTDGETPIVELGKFFDGLKIGHHIEIKYLKNGTVPIKLNEYRTVYERAEKVLSVYYKGYPVYIETNGNLITFLPLSEWEDVVDMVYEAAEKLQSSFRKEKTEEMKEEVKREKMGFLQKLRERWGI